MSEEYLPCPHCDNKPEYHLNFQKDLIELKCTGCGSSFGLYVDCKRFEPDGKAFLMKRWNTRSTSSLEQALCVAEEALEKIQDRADCVPSYVASEALAQIKALRRKE